MDHYYPAYDETFSRFVFSINISRVGLTSVLKSFLPVFFMIFVALLSLLLRADKVTTRLTLNISTLLAAVIMRHTEQKEEARAEKIYKYALYSIPAATILVYVVLFLLV